MTGSRRDLVKKMLTTRFCDRLKDEESDILKKRKRDSSNNLMTSDVDKLMEEESESSAGLSKVGWAGSTMISTVISTTVPTTMEGLLGGFSDDGAWRMVPYDDGAGGS